METAVLILLPFIASIGSFAYGERSVKYYAFAASLLIFIASLYPLINFCYCDAIQFSMDLPWIPSLGIQFSVGMDGISLLLVLLTTFLVPIIILSAFNKNYSNPKLLFGLILLMEAALIGVFVARDAFLFYIFWELALIPIYFICLIWGGIDRIRITFKFFIYTLFGSLIMLLGIIYLYLLTPNNSFAISDFYALAGSMDLTTQSVIFWAFFLAFAIKMPIFPFHTWQPDTYTSSPAQGTMLLSGIMLKMGIYGVIRWLLPIVPAAIEEWKLLVIILSVIGIIYASIIAILQKDIKRLIAYVSIAHVGLIAAGVFSGSEIALQGAVLQMISHGITVVGLFYIIDIIQQRTNTLEIAQLGGIRNVAPVFTTLFLIILLGTVALPLTSGFVSEFLIFVGLFQYNYFIAGIAALTIVFGAFYMLRSFQMVMLGETNQLTEGFQDLKLSEKAVLIPIVALILLIGVYPEPFLQISEPAVKALLQTAGKAYSLK